MFLIIKSFIVQSESREPILKINVKTIFILLISIDSIIESDFFWVETLKPALKLSIEYLINGFSDLTRFEILPVMLIVEDFTITESGGEPFVRISVPGKYFGELLITLKLVVTGKEIPRVLGKNFPSCRLLFKMKFSTVWFVPILSWRTWKSASFLL